MVLWQFSPPSRRESRCSCLHAQCPALESGPETIGGVKIQLAILDILDEQERVLLGQVEMLSTDASFGFLQQATFEFWSHEPVLFLQFFAVLRFGLRATDPLHRRAAFPRAKQPATFGGDATRDWQLDTCTTEK